ncbi:hypothetical protein FT663_03507 [Candidozyma haemuli var. vulneris]|uniref:Knr4/Smi1-like domain-containing protein n=1 Tax=Candidozyma haemuli TaxID=45357 RepID=A0A2V1AVN2_9ASCO|nr:hypothetical protein CXQ85_000360 [[Candida] haemuloni]KAF3988193.1 hypothetical protein FT662_03539 [[Candida] haemuloni var. vulneris]KAF3989651.1 hypothetical protein FT663_03507 [[Candida] haemuloni var. vulneris]PVH21383.1 hypothetical protein CXQ85_000360 [[Candida] haemuloni]
MKFTERVKEFVYSLSATDKYSDYDSRKSFNRVNKPSAKTSLLSHHDNSSTVSFANGPTGDVTEGVHEVTLAWRHIKKWLHKHSPELNTSLSTPCTEADLNEFQKDLNYTLPECVVEFFRLTDGQSSLNDGGFGGLVFGLKLMSIDEIAVMAASWKSVHQEILKQMPVQRVAEPRTAQIEESNLGSDLSDGHSEASYSSNSRPESAQRTNSLYNNQRSVPPGAIQPIYAHSRWTPLITDEVGNCIGVDLSHSPEASGESANQGKWGQVILFGRDFNTKFKIADNFGDFLLIFANDLEMGNWELKENAEVEDIMCGVDTELVYIDPETKKETPYMDALRRRAVSEWISSLSEEELKSQDNQDLLKHLKQEFSYKVPVFENKSSDDFLNDNLRGIDQLNTPLPDQTITEGDITHENTVVDSDDEDH